MPKRTYRKRKGYKKKTKNDKFRKMVGEPPSTIERIAHGASAVGQLAKAILPMALAINTEFKYKDVATAGSVIVSPASVAPIGMSTDIVEGLNDTDRVGNSILLQSYLLRLRFMIKYDNALTDVIKGFLARVIVFCWKEDAEINTPSVDKILEADSNILSPLDKEFSEQFVVLRDDIFPVNDQWQNSKTDNNAVDVGAVFFRQYYDKLHIHAHYDNANHATTNHVYFLVMADVATSGTAGNTSLQVDSYSRINYTDN